MQNTILITGLYDAWQLFGQPGPAALPTGLGMRLAVWLLGGGGLPALADAVELEVGAHSDRLSSVRHFNAIITVDHRLCWPGCKRKLCKLEQTVKL